MKHWFILALLACALKYLSGLSTSSKAKGRYSGSLGGLWTEFKMATQSKVNWDGRG